jgi:prolipoprotein diacylglyceryltransferase
MGQWLSLPMIIIGVVLLVCSANASNASLYWLLESPVPARLIKKASHRLAFICPAALRPPR